MLHLRSQLSWQSTGLLIRVSRVRTPSGTLAQVAELERRRGPFKMGFDRNFNRNIWLGLKILRPLLASRFESWSTHCGIAQWQSALQTSSCIRRRQQFFFCIRSTMFQVRILVPQLTGKPFEVSIIQKRRARRKTVKNPAGNARFRI